MAAAARAGLVSDERMGSACPGAVATPTSAPCAPTYCPPIRLTDRQAAWLVGWMARQCAARESSAAVADDGGEKAGVASTAPTQGMAEVTSC